MVVVRVPVRFRMLGERGGGYGVELELLVDDRVERIVIDRLARRPGSAFASFRGDDLVIEFFDEAGEGFASCIIHLPNLERRECRSLLVPG